MGTLTFEFHVFDRCTTYTLKQFATHGVEKCNTTNETINGCAHQGAGVHYVNPWACEHWNGRINNRTGIKYFGKG